MADSAHVAALKRQRSHLKEAGADPAKLAENAEHLRLAGVDPDKLDEPKEDRAPVDRNAGKRQTADAPTAPESKDVTGSGGLTLPKSGVRGGK